MKQLNIFDYEYDVLRKVLDTLEAVKIANRSAYQGNVYWKMGFDTAEKVIRHELERGEYNDT